MAKFKGLIKCCEVCSSEFNLQILPGVESLRKNNRVWPNMW